MIKQITVSLVCEGGVTKTNRTTGWQHPDVRCQDLKKVHGEAAS